MASTDAARAAVSHVTPTRGPGAASPAILIGGGDGSHLRALLDGPWLGVTAPVAVLYIDDGSSKDPTSEFPSTLPDDDRVRIGKGASARAALLAAFENDPAIFFEPSAIAVGDATLSKAAIERARADLLALHQERLAVLETAHRNWRMALAKGVKPSIFASADRSTTALKHLGREMIGAARKLGATATFHETDFQHDPFRPIRRLRAFLTAQPTMVLSFVSSRERSYGSVAEGLQCISYWSSDPERYGLDEQRFGSDDLVCVADRQWGESFRRRGISPLHVPLASGLHEHSLNAPSGSGNNSVLVVGNMPFGVDVLPPHLADCAARCAAVAGSDATELPADLKAREDAAGSLRRAVEFERTGRARRDVVVALAAAGFDVVVHGDERWAKVLAGTSAARAWRGPLEGRAAHAHAFRTAGAVVNVVSCNEVDAVNMRAFDVAAVGGLLVSSDRPGLRDAFVIGEECLSFASTEELVDQVRDAMRDPARRSAMRERGRLKVLAQHTWEARWRTILAVFAQRRR